MPKFYETIGARVYAPKPKHLANKSANEIVAYLQKHFKANKSTAYLQAIAVAIFDPIDWKNPIYAKFPDCGKEWAKATIIWYHGAKPLESFIGVYSRGYAC